MGAPIQTLGYPSRTAAVAALRAQGLTVPQIAAETGIAANIVHCLLRSERVHVRRNRSRPNGYWGQVRQIGIPVDDLAILVPQAAKRRISVNELVRQLIFVITEDGLVDSVLDDADAKARF